MQIFGEIDSWVVQVEFHNFPAATYPPVSLKQGQISRIIKKLVLFLFKKNGLKSKEYTLKNLSKWKKL